MSKADHLSEKLQAQSQAAPMLTFDDRLNFGQARTPRLAGCQIPTQSGPQLHRTMVQISSFGFVLRCKRALYVVFALVYRSLASSYRASFRPFDPL